MVNELSNIVRKNSSSTIHLLMWIRFFWENTLIYKYNLEVRNFPNGPMVKNLPCNAEEMDLIPGCGTKVLQTEQLSPHAITRVHALRGKIPHDATKIPHASTETWSNQINIKYLCIF